MPQSLTLEFYYYTLDHNKNSRYVEGDKFIQQAIKLRLSTEQGTITNDDNFGSRLYSIMHSNLDDSKLLDAIVDIAKEALSDILPNANITASKIDTNYYDYHDTVKLTIKHDNKTYFYTL
jgi:phage baseplate assembly protein W